MAYDSKLAERIRAILGKRKNISEKAMFGGIAWMLNDYMFVGLATEDLMVRVGADAHDAALALPHARPMDFTGKPMRGYVYVAQQGLKTDAKLVEWIERAESFVRTLPPKKPKVGKGSEKVVKKSGKSAKKTDKRR